MFDVVIEILRAIVLCGILAFFVAADKNIQFGRRGYLCIKLGFLLVVFGAIMDITDNFESLNWTVVAGDTPMQSFLEKIVGYLGGFILLGIGFSLWLPSFKRLECLQDDLEDARRELEQKVLSKTHELDREKNKRRTLEATMAIAEERQMALYEKAPVAIAQGLIGGSLVDRNQAFADMLGYDSPQDIVAAATTAGDPFVFWPYPEDVKRLLGLLRQEKHYRGFEGRMRRKDGRDIWVSIDFTTLEDRAGQNYYFYAFAEDITERKRAGEILAESEKRLRIIMDSMPAGLFLVDMETQEIADVNVALLAMTGYGREDLVGQHCCEKMCPSEKGSCPVNDVEGELFSQNRMIRRKDGSELPVFKTVARVKLNGREYLLETIVDVSEQRMLEDFKQEVDRIVAHDLKAPIIGVINACKVLLLDEGGIGAETREMLEIIERQGHKVLRMIGMSLAVYKMEAGTFHYDPEPIDFLKVINEVRGEQSGTARLKGITMPVLVDGKEPVEGRTVEVQGDEMLFENMVTNLLTNAIEAAPFGGEVTISLVDGDPVVVSITNKGAVPENIRSDFFEKYATSGKSAGTGLGTYSAKLVADTVGCEISMETSDVDDTTTVMVKLPK